MVLLDEDFLRLVALFECLAEREADDRREEDETILLLLFDDDLHRFLLSLDLLPRLSVLAFRGVSGYLLIRSVVPVDCVDNPRDLRRALLRQVVPSDGVDDVFDLRLDLFRLASRTD